MLLGRARGGWFCWWVSRASAQGAVTPPRQGNRILIEVRQSNSRSVCDLSRRGQIRPSGVSRNPPPETRHRLSSAQGRCLVAEGGVGTIISATGRTTQKCSLGGMNYSLARIPPVVIRTLYAPAQEVTSGAGGGNAAKAGQSRLDRSQTIQ